MNGTVILGSRWTDKWLPGLALGLCLTLATAYGQTLPQQVGDQEIPSLAPIIEQVAPAVVNISVQGSVATNNSPSQDPFFRRFSPPNGRREVQSAGSGVIIDAENGYILTNHHVIDNADEITVSLIDDRTLDATVVGSDAGSDIAVLQVDPDDLLEMPFGDSEGLRVGDFVLAIGNPFRLRHTVTSGIVSGLSRLLRDASTVRRQSTIFTFAVAFTKLLEIGFAVRCIQLIDQVNRL